MIELPEHPCFRAKCKSRSWWNTEATIWTQQHGDNPEHRRSFTLKELFQSDVIAVKKPCGYDAHDWHEDEMYVVRYEWLRALHRYEAALTAPPS